jgi:hypothetical protein
MDPEKANLAATLLERVARGELEASTALTEWPQDATSDELLIASWHDLSHFAADLDVRSKDPRYKTYQVSLLLKRVKQIKEKYGFI